MVCINGNPNPQRKPREPLLTRQRPDGSIWFTVTEFPEGPLVAVFDKEGRVVMTMLGIEEIQTTVFQVTLPNNAGKLLASRHELPEFGFTAKVEVYNAAGELLHGERFE